MIELLVVIAIIALLAALILPALSQAKAKAKRVYCQNNLRQLSLAFEMYVGDHGRYPVLTVTRLMKPSITSISIWNAFLLPYVASNRTLYNCPGFPMEYQWTTNNSAIGCNFPTNIQGNRLFCYGVNAMGVSNLGESSLGVGDELGVGRKLGEIRNPADMIVLGDNAIQLLWSTGEYRKLDRWGELDAYYSYFLSNAAVHVSRIHSDGANMAFEDGHVEWAKWGKWVERSHSAARRWNYDNESHCQF